ncbi:hypothetical protein ACLB2K_012056 [Fragaria x ananassa]
MNHIQFDGHPNWSHELRLLAMKPIVSRVYPICKVNGVQFICEQRDSRRRTQNSGVMAHGGRNGVDYYGVLHSVVDQALPRYYAHRKECLRQCGGHSA